MADELKATEVPAQTLLAEGVAVTDTGSSGFTIIVTAFEMAGFPEAHFALEISWQVTTSPFTGIIEYVALVALIALVPFTFH